MSEKIPNMGLTAPPVSGILGDMTTTHTTTKQITPDFIGVMVDGQKAGHIIRSANGWIASTSPADVGTPAIHREFVSSGHAARWIAEKTAKVQS